jgi:hypothetical protein
MNNPDGYEVKHTDSVGIIFDIALAKAGSQKNRDRRQRRAPQIAPPAG